jgi:TBC1 domain family member 8/9
MLSSLVQRAQSLIDPSAPLLNPLSDRNPSKGTLFRHQFRLPDSQSPLQEITTELNLPLPHGPTARDTTQGEKSKDGATGIRYVGKLHLSESFLCFSTQTTSFLQTASTTASTAYTGQTHGAGPSGNGFTLPLCAIRRVERLNSQNHIFSLALTTWNGATTRSSSKDTTDVQKFTLQLAGSRQACEKFCDGLKKGLREGIKDVESLRTGVAECYSEYLLASSRAKPKDGSGADVPAPEPPDAGLGMVFRYPGDARKLRDRSKMRLWGEYMRGWSPIPRPWTNC